MRLFVGVPLPDEVRESLGALCSGLPGARWVRPENMHVTLRFIGEVDRDTAEDIDATLAEVRAPAFALKLSGVGSFQSGRRVRVVWAGIEPCEALVRLHGKVESAVVRTGLESERRRFKSHITLARLKNTPSAKVGDYIEDRNAFAVEPFPVPHFTLFRSHLGREGAHYESLADYPLAGAP